MKLTKKERDVLKLKYNCRCAYCGEPLNKGWHADHILPVRRNNDGTVLNPENNHIDNFNPACASCNIQKSSLTIEQFRSKIKQLVQSLNLYYSPYQIAKRFNLIYENDVKVIFFFEIYENQNNYCNCDFVIVQKDANNKDYCYECKKPIKTISE